MSRELVESILNNDYVSANRLLEEKLSDIQEKKLYEVKRSIQLVELMGYRGYGAKSGPLVGKTDAEKREFWKEKIAQRKGEREYAQSKKKPTATEPKKASEVLPSPKKSSALKKVAKSKWPGRVGFGIGRAIKMTGGVLSDIGSQLTPNFE